MRNIELLQNFADIILKSQARYFIFSQMERFYIS